MSFELMRKRIEQSGSALHHEQIKDARDILAYGFQDDVSYNPNISDLTTGHNIPIKIYDQKFSASYGVTAKFLALHDAPVELGQLLFDSLKNEYWLCVESYDVSGIHNEGKLGKCMTFLKWQDSNGIIRSTPVIITSASKYNNGELGTESIKLGSDQLMIFAQLNDSTVKLDRGMIFFIDENKQNPSAYELTRIDTGLYAYMGKGVVSIILTECTYTPTDVELRLGVCNYHDMDRHRHKEPMETENHDITASISGNPVLNVGYPRTYSINCSHDGLDFSWEVKSDFTIGTELDAGKIKLFTDDKSLNGKDFLLQAIIDEKVIVQKKIIISEGF